MKARLILPTSGHNNEDSGTMKSNHKQLTVKAYGAIQKPQSL